MVVKLELDNRFYSEFFDKLGTRVINVSIAPNTNSEPGTIVVQKKWRATPIITAKLEPYIRQEPYYGSSESEKHSRYDQRCFIHEFSNLSDLSSRIYPWVKTRYHNLLNKIAVVN